MGFSSRGERLGAAPNITRSIGRFTDKEEGGVVSGWQITKRKG